MSVAFNFHYSIQEIFPQLKSYAMFLTRDQVDSLDLFQETCYKAYKNFKSFKPGTNLKNWSFAIMRNSYINSYRKNKRKQSVFTAKVSDHFIDAHAIGDSENAATSTFVMDDLQAPINSLPLGTVKTRIHLARKKLQGMLQVKEYRMAS